MHILLSKGLLKEQIIETNPPANDCNADPITNSASFKYKSSLAEKTPNNDNDNNNVMQDVKIVVPLKHLSIFWRTFDILTWSTN